MAKLTKLANFRQNFVKIAKIVMQILIEPAWHAWERKESGLAVMLTYRRGYRTGYLNSGSSQIDLGAVQRMSCELPFIRFYRHLAIRNEPFRHR